VLDTDNRIFAKMPLEVFKDNRLSKTELRVLGILLTFMRPPERMYCFPKRETISNLSGGLNVSKISTATSNLVKFGWLDKVGNGGKSCSSRYYFKVPVLADTDVVTVANPVTVTTIVRGKKEITIEIDKVSDWNKDFDQFWNIYPCKVSKQAALQAWKKLKPNGQLCEQIIAAVKNAVDENPQWTQQNGKFIPHPATYLNNRRWEDELSTKKSEGNNNNHAKGNINANNQKRNRRDHASLIDDSLNEIINRFVFEADDDDISTF
jgi:hypothetical protein